MNDWLHKLPVLWMGVVVFAYGAWRKTRGLKPAAA